MSAVLKPMLIPIVLGDTTFHLNTMEISRIEPTEDRKRCVIYMRDSRLLYVLECSYDDFIASIVSMTADR